MRARLAALGLTALLVPGVARAALDNPFPDEVVISPGIKLGWMFGGDHGFTWGFELSILFRTGPDLDALLAQGPVLNLGVAPDFQARLGWEIVSWFIGLEAGPEIVHTSEGMRFSLGVTPWVGAFWVVPYYTHHFVIGAESMDEVGTYLKLPLCPACESSNHGSHSFDFHD